MFRFVHVEEDEMIDKSDNISVMLKKNKLIVFHNSSDDVHHYFIHGNPFLEIKNTSKRYSSF